MYAGRVAEIGPVADVIHNPQHPYTVGLMGSIPESVDSDRDRLIQIDGAMPAARPIPSAAPSTPAAPKCSTNANHPSDLMPASSSMAACWLHEGKVWSMSTFVQLKNVSKTF